MHMLMLTLRTLLLMLLQIDVVTDSTIDTIKTNQIPFIQSLAEALSIDTSQIYWYNLTQSDLNTVRVAERTPAVTPPVMQ